jgi:hypothetical protein
MQRQEARHRNPLALHKLEHGAVWETAFLVLGNTLSPYG